MKYNPYSFDLHVSDPHTVFLIDTQGVSICKRHRPSRHKIIVFKAVALSGWKGFMSLITTKHRQCHVPKLL
jgi:hypothetical protein